MFSMRDAAIVVALICTVGAIGVLAGLRTWRRRWGKVVLVLLCLGFAATLYPAVQRGRIHWRAHGVRAFVRASIEQLNAGQLPELSDQCTDGVVQGIEALKGTGLPTDFTVLSIRYAGPICTLDLSTPQGEPFWCMVEVNAPDTGRSAGGAYRLLELAPPESSARQAAPVSESAGPE